jgi:hypothetical protein
LATLSRLLLSFFKSEQQCHLADGKLPACEKG